MYFLWACGLGALSAVSLPLGSWIGLRWKFSATWLSILAAFGAGALLAALSVELVAPTALALTNDEVESSAAREEFLALIIGCVGGGLVYVWLDRTVNESGGFVRRRTISLRYDRRAAQRKREELLDVLGSLPQFDGLQFDERDDLLAELELGSFKDGETISRRGSTAEEVFFVLSGRVTASTDSGESASIDAGMFTSGLFPLLAGGVHVVDDVADGDVEALRISESGFHELIRRSPEFDNACRKEVARRIDGFRGIIESRKDELLRWAESAKTSLEDRSEAPTLPGADRSRGEDHDHATSPLAVWLGMVLDGIPESLVLGAGMLWAIERSTRAGTTPGFLDVVPFTLIAGLFLSNFPEALSSSANMLRRGMTKRAIFNLWLSLMAITAIGSGIGYLTAGHLSPTWTVLFEGLSAGAMLTMIVSAMLPEAVALGSSNVAGLSTLAGFLAAILFKLLE